MDGDAGIQAMLAELDALRTLEERAAAEAAPLVEAAAKAYAAAGVDPTTGDAWAPKVGGGRAGANAARDVTAKAFGNVIKVAVDGDHVHLHLGRGKSQVARHVIPVPGAPIPDTYAAAIAEGVRRAWEKGGGP